MSLCRARLALHPPTPARGPLHRLHVRSPLPPPRSSALSRHARHHTRTSPRHRPRRALRLSPQRPPPRTSAQALVPREEGGAHRGGRRRPAPPLQEARGLDSPVRLAVDELSDRSSGHERLLAHGAHRDRGVRRRPPRLGPGRVLAVPPLLLTGKRRVRARATSHDRDRGPLPDRVSGRQRRDDPRGDRLRARGGEDRCRVQRLSRGHRRSVGGDARRRGVGSWTKRARRRIAPLRSRPTSSWSRD